MKAPIADPTTAQYIFSKVKRLGMPFPMDMLPIDMSMPPISIPLMSILNDEAALSGRAQGSADGPVEASRALSRNQEVD